MQYNTIQYNTIRYNTIRYDAIQYYCGENETSLALIGQCNQIEQRNTIQYNIYTIQYNTMQCNTKQYNTIRYDAIQYYCGENETSLALIGQCNQIEHRNTIQYNIYNTIQYNTIQCNTIKYNTIRYDAIQYYCGKNDTGLALFG